MSPSLRTRITSILDGFIHFMDVDNDAFFFFFFFNGIQNISSFMGGLSILFDFVIDPSIYWTVIFTLLG